eukprot:2872582-Pyramimonas_sp.AAC.1
MALVLARHSALCAPRPRLSNSCSALSAGFPATRRVRFRGLTGMRARGVAACRYDVLGERLERSNLRPKRQHRIRMTCRPKSSLASRMGPNFQK